MAKSASTPRRPPDSPDPDASSNRRCAIFVAELGFDEAFRRMWTLYLAYSEAGFRSGYLDVRQILLTRESEPSAPGASVAPLPGAAR